MVGMDRDDPNRTGPGSDLAGDDFTEQMHEGEQQADAASGATEGATDAPRDR